MRMTLFKLTYPVMPWLVACALALAVIELARCTG
jgi:hypothetical protein